MSNTDLQIEFLKHHIGIDGIAKLEGMGMLDSVVAAMVDYKYNNFQPFLIIPADRIGEPMSYIERLKQAPQVNIYGDEVDADGHALCKTCKSCSTPLPDNHHFPCLCDNCIGSII